MNFKATNIEDHTLFDKTPPPDDLKKKENISSQTKDKVEAAKSYIENKYSKLKREELDKREKWDLLNQKMEQLDLNDNEKERIKRDILHKEAEQLRMKRKKLTPDDFDSLSIIGRGAFGEVRLCRWKETGEIVVIKKMKKAEMIFKNQVTHIRAERDVLAAANILWIVELKCSFQDDIFLYLVMEYLPGGDLMTLLMKKDILTEDEAKFYIAESILAVDAVHKLNYIHRDLKPDNVLIDRNGHIKLTDFGLCKHTEIRPKKLEILKKDDKEKEKPGLQLEIGKKPGFRRNRQMAYSTVGTPDYIAPEVFAQNGYTETVDWWSLGTILFEMLVGYPPFFSDDPSVTCQKILHWRKSFAIPAEANLSPAAIDLLRRLITDANERLGINGVEEIKAHPFFAGIDWKRLREKKSPSIPDLKNETDTCNFDKFDEEEPWVPDYTKHKKTRKDVFIGYTFNRNIENQRSSLVAALIDLETNKGSAFRANENLMTLPDVQEEEKIENKKEEILLSSKLQNNPSFTSTQFERKKKEQEVSNITATSSFLKKNIEKPLGGQLNSNLTSNSFASKLAAFPSHKPSGEKSLNLNDRPNSLLNLQKKSGDNIQAAPNPVSHLKMNIIPNSKNFKLNDIKKDLGIGKNIKGLGFKDKDK